MDGKNKKASALAAGYSEKTAKHPKEKIESKPAVKDLFATSLRLAGVSDKHLARRIYQGLNATQTKFATWDGDITDSQETINYAERREMVELVLKFKGLLVDKHEVSGRLTLEQLLDGTHE